MEPCERYVRRVFFGSLVLLVIPAGALFLTGLVAAARGVALGGAASLLNFLLMSKDVRRQKDSSRRPWPAASTGAYSLTMVTIAAALLYAVVNDGVSFLATIPALFCVQAVLILDGLAGWMDGHDRSLGKND